MGPDVAGETTGRCYLPAELAQDEDSEDEIEKAQSREDPEPRLAPDGLRVGCLHLVKRVLNRGEFDRDEAELVGAGSGRLLEAGHPVGAELAVGTLLADAGEASGAVVLGRAPAEAVEPGRDGRAGVDALAVDEDHPDAFAREAWVRRGDHGTVAAIGGRAPVALVLLDAGDDRLGAGLGTGLGDDLGAAVLGNALVVRRALYYEHRVAVVAVACRGVDGERHRDDERTNGVRRDDSEPECISHDSPPLSLMPPLCG